MKLREKLFVLLAFMMGIVVGFSVHFFIGNRMSSHKPGYQEKHEGQVSHINPLLACDVAEDLLGDPELIPFKDEIKAFITARMDKRWASRVSVYFRELNDGHWFSIGDTEKFTPASLRKVPLMIALLKQSESDHKLLDRLVTFDLSTDYNAAQNVKPARSLVLGNSYSIRDLIVRMIVNSDNNAFTLLTKYVDGRQLDIIYANLHLLNPRAISDDDFLSVQTYESFFRILYNASFLSRGASDWALALLAKSDFRSGLVAGVPPSIEVAHKFGEKSDATSGTVQLHDCGIIYYPKHPYLLCVMSQGANFEYLDDVIAEISRLTFNAVDRQSRRNLVSK